MNHLYYRTRRSSAPHGKPCVFFSCHPAEFVTYFKATAELLLKYNDCVVVYESAAEQFAEKELRSHLGQMQLIVIIVTTKLLTKSNRTMELVYPYALERHIPVLPLMMENGLDDVFQKQFGDLQYLSPNENDPTAIPFEQRFEKYLSAVLVGDKLAAIVRSSFDAYIFLSYRKKDRRFAQELMKMIHRSPHYRDIAIWYDEYLVPGENFNENIREALKKSDLFVLVVTPSLLETPNYVMDHEYPAAKEAGKVILPVEMQPTDQEKLQEDYEDLPDCVKGEENEDWISALVASLKHIALAETKNDPLHSFLIGLAYLNGIDVEVDSERAIQLITGAAESGLEVAIRQMVSMYETGKGVERNYHTAVEWREKRVALLRERYKKSGSEENYGLLFSELCNLGDAWVAVGNPDKGWIAYEEMRVLSERVSFKASKRNLSVCYNRLGIIAEEQGQLTEAKKYYEKSLSIREELARETGTAGARGNLSSNYNRLGIIAEAQGQLTEAKEYYEKSLSIKEELARETGTAMARSNLSVGYQNLGDLAEAQGQLTEAKGYYEKSLSIREELVRETETVEARSALSSSYNRLGDIAKEQGRLTEAKEYYEKSLSISEELVRETGTVKARSALSDCYNNLGEIARLQGCLAEAKRYCKQAVAIKEQLANETGMIEARSELPISYACLGEIAKEQGFLAEAKEYFEKSLDISVELVKETEKVEARRCWFISYYELGCIAFVQGQFTEAERYFEKSLSISVELAKETETVNALDNLATSYYNISFVTADKPEYLKKAIEIWTQLVEQCPAVAAYQKKRDRARKLMIIMSIISPIRAIRKILKKTR